MYGDLEPTQFLMEDKHCRFVPALRNKKCRFNGTMPGMGLLFPNPTAGVCTGTVFGMYRRPEI